MNREKAIRIISINKMKSLTDSDRELYLLNYWPLDENDDDFYLLDDDIRLEMRNYSEPRFAFSDSRYDVLILLSLEDSYTSYGNKDLSNEVSKIIRKNAIVTGEEPHKYICPCCGNKTLDSIGEYDICPICHWEDNGITDEETYSAPNHMTLKESRERYKNGQISSNTLTIDKFIDAVSRRPLMYVYEKKVDYIYYLILGYLGGIKRDDIDNTFSREFLNWTLEWLNTNIDAKYRQRSFFWYHIFQDVTDSEEAATELFFKLSRDFFDDYYR